MSRAWEDKRWPHTGHVITSEGFLIKVPAACPTIPVGHIPDPCPWVVCFFGSLKRKKPFSSQTQEALGESRGEWQDHTARMGGELFRGPLLGSSSLPTHDAHMVLERRSGEPGSEGDARA